MYTSIDNTVLDKLAGLEITCYIAIKKFVNFRTQIAKVGVRRISEEMGVSKNTALKYINKLVEKKVIIKRTNYNPIKKAFDINQYFFTHLVQKNNESSQAGEPKLSNTDKSVIVEKTIDVESIKKQLEEKYSIDIVKKAVQCLKKAVKHGTIVNNLKSYLNTLCINIKAQLQLIASVANDNSNVQGGHYPPQSQQKKKSTAANSRFSKNNKFHNFFQRTSLYSKEELEKMLLK
ncbi:hypothetical protein [Inediibacterium massiliense]|uniref:hypothetical protein n=1 Tax=Inediibacterium massiliense TaxID=1658111 RepID=UPI0006B45719|nr:hypothetical protein [Inediibacterium massiliense]